MQNKGDGEFWMELLDYMKHFRDTHICNFTPDFDEDGSQDNLGNVADINKNHDQYTVCSNIHSDRSDAHFP